MDRQINFKRIYEKAKKNEVDILITNMIFDYQDNIPKNEIKVRDYKVISGKEYIEIFFQNIYGYTCNKLIKRNLYIENIYLVLPRNFFIRVSRMFK